MNSLNSRSTIACICSFATLLTINLMALKAGFFTTEFAIITVYLCRDILLSLLTHQEKSDELASSTSDAKQT